MQCLLMQKHGMKQHEVDAWNLIMTFVLLAAVTLIVPRLAGIWTVTEAEGKLAAEGYYVNGYEKVDVYIDGGDFRVAGGQYSGVDTYSDTDATEFHHNGGSAMIFGTGIDSKNIIKPIKRPIIPGLKISFCGEKYFLSPLISVIP